jgi:hypothetical protein
LKRVLILCEYFPPYDNTAAYRPFSWYKFLPKHGMYPIVFCKNYINAEHHFVVKEEFGEVHHIGVKEDTIKVKIEKTSYSILKSIFIIIDILLENSTLFNTKKSLKNEADKYLQQNDIDIIIATASPFVLFEYASKLSAKFGLPWIADYRDDWTTNEVFLPNKFVKLIKKFDYFREKKFTKSASIFITVSNHYLEKIERLIKKKGIVIENGFLPQKEDHTVPEIILSTQKLSILYTGLLYPSQKIGMLLEAIKILNENFANDYELIFIGGNPKYFLRSHGNIECLKFLPRVSREEALRRSKAADLLLFLPFYGSNGILKGVPASKLYDYIYSRKPILVCGNDKDIVEDKLTQTKQGYFCEDAMSLAETIIGFIQQKKINPKIPLVKISDEVFNKNSREYQTKLLATELKKIMLNVI